MNHISRSTSARDVYCEIIATNHTLNSANEEEEKTNGVFSRRKCFFLLDDNSKGCPNEEFQFQFPKGKLAFYSFKLAIESLIQDVSKDDQSNADELRKFLKSLSGRETEYSSEERVFDLALQFYTTFAKLPGRLLLQRRVSLAFQNQGKGIENFADLILMNFLLLALAKLPFYEKDCVRAIDLDQKERDIYHEGSIINWKNFNSSSKGDKPAPPFDQRDTYFYLSSLTGRDVSQISNSPKEEEVLFPPGCNFFVTKVVEGKVDGKTKTHIYMKQVQITFTDNIVFFVGNQVTNEDRQLLSELHGQTFEHRLCLNEMANAKEAIEYLCKNLNGHISQSKSFQIIVKSEITQDASDEIFTLAKKIFNTEKKLCLRYCFKKEGEENFHVEKKDDILVNNHKNLKENLQSKFQHESCLLENTGMDDDLNSESHEDNNSRDERDSPVQNLYNESVNLNFQLGQQGIIRAMSSAGVSTTFTTGHQTQSLSNNTSNFESNF